MSVVGIDFGNRWGVIGVAQKGGIDVLMNEVSNRQTSYVYFFQANSLSFTAQWFHSVKKRGQLASLLQLRLVCN